MESIKIDQKASLRADIIAFSENNEPILLVEVKSNELKNKNNSYTQKAIKQLTSYLNATDKLIPFAMLVTPEIIQIFQWDGVNLSNPIVCLQTADVLTYHEAEFKSKRIFHLYLTTLIEAWLRDLAYHWKSQNPPAIKELEAIGLLEKLANGTTRTEVKINDTLR